MLKYKGLYFYCEESKLCYKEYEDKDRDIFDWVDLRETILEIVSTKNYLIIFTKNRIFIMSGIPQLFGNPGNMSFQSKRLRKGA